MDIHELIHGIEGCDCGKDHRCPVDFINIGPNALDCLPQLCSDYRHILLISDENTWKACGCTAHQLISEKIGFNFILTSHTDVIIPNEEKIAEIEAALTTDTDLIIGVGSGVINDLCKYVSFCHGLPYYIIATAPSMDGYVSVGAALILGGMKVTLNARPPKAVIADTGILKNAPMEMIQAGYGDIIGKFSCLNDWKLSSLINGEYFCQRVYDLTYDCAVQVSQLAQGIAARNEKTIGLLMEALVVVGIAMAYVDCSRPASGSEHHFSHFFEITGILENKPYFSHGIDVAFSAVVTALLREAILQRKPIRRNFDRAVWEQEIRRVYASSADGIIALQDKLGWYEKEDSVQEQWPRIRDLLLEAPSADAFNKMLDAVGLHFDDFINLYGTDKIRDAVLYAKDLKDRYTVLWLYYTYFR